MSVRLFVGNLSYSTNDGLLQATFAAHGEVLSATVVLDRMTGRSRGFGFVEYASAADAQRATQAMNGALVDGRAVAVNAAREREAASGRGGFGGGLGDGGALRDDRVGRGGDRNGRGDW